MYDIWNLVIIGKNGMNIGDYSFKSNDLSASIVVYEFDPRKHKNTHTCEYGGKIEEDDTYIWRKDWKPDGEPGQFKVSPIDHDLNKNIKHINDIALAISILTGCNVVITKQEERVEQNKLPIYFPALSKNKIPVLCDSVDDLARHVPNIIKCIKSDDFREKYKNGFHLVSYRNASNIYNNENRFLAYIILWELLYFIENEDEAIGLNKIFTELLKGFGIRENFSQTNPSIFYLIRNQLAHNGMFPFSGRRLEMAPEVFANLTALQSQRYMRFFEYLTYALVLNTLKFSFKKIEELMPKITAGYQHPEFCGRVHTYKDDLEKFILNNGHIPSYHEDEDITL